LVTHSVLQGELLLQRLQHVLLLRLLKVPLLLLLLSILLLLLLVTANPALEAGAQVCWERTLLLLLLCAAVR
jgi:hypothetical protein